MLSSSVSTVVVSAHIGQSPFFGWIAGDNQLNEPDVMVSETGTPNSTP